MKDEGGEGTETRREERKTKDQIALLMLASPDGVSWPHLDGSKQDRKHRMGFIGTTYYLLICPIHIPPT